MSTKHLALHLDPTEDVRGLTPVAILRRAGIVSSVETAQVSLHLSLIQAEALRAEWDHRDRIIAPFNDATNIREIRVEQGETMHSASITFVIDEPIDVFLSR